MRHKLPLIVLALSACWAQAAETDGVVLETSNMLAMRDGARLAMDLYFPGSKGSARWPVILIRTPYNKDNWRTADNYTRSPMGAARYFARNGYVVAIQDVRGKYESEGAFSALADAVTDFPETLAWLAKQPWSTGKVGTYGCSYLGEIQYIQAGTRQPALKTVLAQAGSGSLGGAQGRYRYFGTRNGGAFEVAMGLGWFMEHGSRYSLELPHDVDLATRRQLSPLLKYGPSMPDVDYDAAVKSLPLQGLVDRLGGPPTDWDFFLTTPITDPVWRKRGYLQSTSAVDVTGLHVNSWYDFGVREIIATWQHFKEKGSTQEARDNQYLLLGGGSHCENEIATANTFVGMRSIGDPRFDYWSLYLHWFDRWLKGRPDALQGVPKVQYYLLGKNEWRHAEEFPPAGAQATSFFLNSKGRANSVFGDGQLTQHPDYAADSRPDSYVYDPANPAPSLGGPLCCTKNKEAKPGAYDQSPVESRDDVLIYQTEPLAKGITVVGPVDLSLFVGSDAPDTDFTAKLVDVYPDGQAFNIQEGILRARYREGFDRQVFMTPGKIYPLTVDVQATANHFGPGHRIRIEVSSSNFPRWDRNLNTGGANYNETKWRKARNSVYHSSESPSRLVLWVMQEQPATALKQAAAYPSQRRPAVR